MYIAGVLLASVYMFTYLDLQGGGKIELYLLHDRYKCGKWHNRQT